MTYPVLPPKARKCIISHAHRQASIWKNSKPYCDKQTSLYRAYSNIPPVFLLSICMTYNAFSYLITKYMLVYGYLVSCLVVTLSPTRRSGCKESGVDAKEA